MGAGWLGEDLRLAENHSSDAVEERRLPMVKAEPEHQGDGGVPRDGL